MWLTMMRGIPPRFLPCGYLRRSQRQSGQVAKGVSLYEVEFQVTVLRGRHPRTHNARDAVARAHGSAPPQYNR